jgi:uncharacterized protein
VDRSADPRAFDAPSADTVAWVAPVPDAFTEPWWAACRERRLLVRSCHACGRFHFPPRPACPYCWSDDVDWHETAGTGTIYTFSVVRENDLQPFASALPYVAAVVELDEGPRLMTTIIDTRSSSIAVGASVAVVFVDRAEWTFPAFRVR